jgi:7-cyano-7-deazaguanine synthase in queuosine biosynthesis
LDTIKLLWTSGWDSTFRLLQIVFLEKKQVQPYYMDDGVRPSTRIELRQMDRIKGAIAKMDVSARQLIHDTVVLKYTADAHDPTLAAQFEAVKNRIFIGQQYLMLAELLKRHELRDMELSVHIDGRLHKLLQGKTIMDDGVYAMKRLPPEEPMNVFSAFRFPLLDLDKNDMEEIASKHGLLHVLNQSWFCHNPDSKERPCGMCNPCYFTVQDGLGRRLPWQSHVRYRLWSLVRGYRKTRRVLDRLLARSRRPKATAK